MIPFTKMQGLGNDFVLLDGIRVSLANINVEQLAREVCDRRLGVGSDGLILVETASDAPFRMRMWNPDGSESEMCGNGIRCVALLLREHGHSTEREVPVETGAGILTVEQVGVSCVRVDMGVARLLRGEIGMSGEPGDSFVDQPISIEGHVLPGTAASMGNPHLVCFVEDVTEVPLERWGPELEQHPLFPNRVNVHFIQVADRANLIQRTWERGAGATLACGTGACASAVAAFVTGRANRSVAVKLPGGELKIDYLEDGRVLMTGPAESTFEGVWPD